MANPVSRGAIGTPVKIAASVAIVVHFALVGVRTLANPSGPWPSRDGMEVAPAPRFAEELNQRVAQPYVRLLRLPDGSHPAGRGPARVGVFVEVQLRDGEGKLVTTVRLPDPQANAWVRSRQQLLAQEFVPDMPVTPRPGEAVPAPNQTVRKVAIWEMSSGRALQLQSTPEHLVPRNRPVYAPSEWSQVLARAYGRYLCRAHGAASAEVIRHSREAVPPGALESGESPPDTFEDLIANYGKIGAD
jgi:hypothetical protein